METVLEARCRLVQFIASESAPYEVEIHGKNGFAMDFHFIFFNPWTRPLKHTVNQKYKLSSGSLDWPIGELGDPPQGPALLMHLLPIGPLDELQRRGGSSTFLLSRSRGSTSLEAYVKQNALRYVSCDASTNPPIGYMYPV